MGDYGSAQSSHHPYLFDPVPLEIKNGKTADIADALDMNGKLAEKVDDGAGARRQREKEYKGCKDDRHEFLEEDVDLEGKEGAKFSMHLFVRVG
jgi:hypothetical protein